MNKIGSDLVPIIWIHIIWVHFIWLIKLKSILVGPYYIGQCCLNNLVWPIWYELYDMGQIQFNFANGVNQRWAHVRWLSVSESVSEVSNMTVFEPMCVSEAMTMSESISDSVRVQVGQSEYVNQDKRLTVFIYAWISIYEWFKNFHIRRFARPSFWKLGCRWYYSENQWYWYDQSWKTSSNHHSKGFGFKSLRHNDVIITQKSIIMEIWFEIQERVQKWLNY